MSHSSAKELGMKTPRKNPRTSTAVIFWQKVFARIEELGLTARAIGSALGVDEPRMSKWKDGVGNPEWNEILYFSNALHVSRAYLVDDSIPVGQIIPLGQSFPAPLSEDQKSIIQMAEKLGYDEAYKRLLGIPTFGSPPSKPKA
jgi:transcriptional regulator with XRE-family HTH domain